MERRVVTHRQLALLAAALAALIEGALVHAAYGQTPTLTPAPTVTATPTGGTHLHVDPSNGNDSSVRYYRMMFAATTPTPGPPLTPVWRGDGTFDAWVYRWQPSGYGPRPGDEIAVEAGNVWGLWSDASNHAVAQADGSVATVTPNGAASATPMLTASATVPPTATSTDTPTDTPTATPTDTTTSTATMTARATATATRGAFGHTRPTPPRIL